jgi:dihydroneopterin aldolase
MPALVAGIHVTPAKAGVQFLLARSALLDSGFRRNDTTWMAGTSPAMTSVLSMDAPVQPVIVKLGGSVVRSPELSAWLDVIAASPRPIVVVPGGGALADEVRAAQTRLGFGDGAAHRMALLAMDQIAWAVAGLRSGFEVGDTEEALRRALEQGHVAVWAPYGLVANRSDIPQSWTVTSDSLALWLGRRLGAECCYVVKSIERSRAEFSAEQLARDGVVDDAFPSMFRDAGFPVFLLGRGDQAALAASLSGDEPTACGATVD